MCVLNRSSLANTKRNRGSTNNDGYEYFGETLCESTYSDSAFFLFKISLTPCSQIAPRPCCRITVSYWRRSVISNRRSAGSSTCPRKKKSCGGVDATRFPHYAYNPSAIPMPNMMGLNHFDR